MPLSFDLFLEARAEILGFLEEVLTPKGNFEINWPLMSINEKVAVYFLVLERPSNKAPYARVRLSLEHFLCFDSCLQQVAGAAVKTNTNTAK